MAGDHILKGPLVGLRKPRCGLYRHLLTCERGGTDTDQGVEIDGRSEKKFRQGFVEALVTQEGERTSKSFPCSLVA